MIKRFIGVVALILTVLSANAEDKNIGLRMGYQNSVMSIDGNKIGSSGNSFYVNAYKDTKLLPFLFFHSGLQYSQSEASIENHDYKINYLGAPVAVKAKFGPVYALGGAAFNVKLNENNRPEDFSSAKWFDTNAFVGGGFKVLFMTIDARYHWGLTDINNGIKNNSFQVGLGLRF